MSIPNLTNFNVLSPIQRPPKQNVTISNELPVDTEGLMSSPAVPDIVAPVPDFSAPQPMNAGTVAQPVNGRDADDKMIAAWFKLMKPNSGDNSSPVKNDPGQDDPGRVPDPLYEPTKANVPSSLKIIEFNDLMRAFAPKKPHWKHYDDVSNQFQVGSQEHDS
jgi:hypothetical protein